MNFNRPHDTGETLNREIDSEKIENETQEITTSTNSTFIHALHKQFSPRFNLTSDYDSSNDSPSGSDATLDESASGEFGYKNVVGKKTSFASTKNENFNKQTDNNDGSLKENEFRCLICGNKRLQTKSSESKQLSPILQPHWPNISPPPPCVPNLDAYGRYLVDDTVYDPDELATNPLLKRIDEWDYPIFELSLNAGDTILSQMSYYVFLEAGLLEAFRIPIQEFLNYFRALELGYRNLPCKNPVLKLIYFKRNNKSFFFSFF